MLRMEPTAALPSRQFVSQPSIVSAAELQEQLLRLAQERRELVDYAERVTRELRRYQQARPPPPPNQPGDDLPLPPWATNMQMMSPLLFAYEERIAELETVIERSVSLAEQAQILAKENDVLRAELNERTEQLRNVQLLGSGGRNGMIGCGDEQQQEELQELYRLSVEQNEALAQQNQLLKIQVERMQQTLAHGQQQMREVNARVVESSRALTAEHERAEALAKQKSVAEQRLDEVTAELVEEVRSREILQAEASKRASDRVEARLQSEIEGLQQQWEHDVENLKNSHRKIVRDLEERLRKTDLAATEFQTKVELLEKQRAREASALSQERANKDVECERLQSDLVESEQARLRLERQLDDTHQELSRLRIEFDALSLKASKRTSERVEARLGDIESLKQQWEQDVESLKGSHRKTIREMEERLRRSESATSEFQTKAELFEKQRAWEAAALERQLAMHNAERDRIRTDLEEAQQARLRLERQHEDLLQQLTQLRSEFDASSSKAKEQIAQAAAEQVSLRARYQASEQQLAQEKDELKILHSRVSVAEAEKLRLTSELQEERLRASDQLETEKRRCQNEKRALERKLQALKDRAQQEEQAALKLLKSQEALSLQWKAELGLERDALESQVERLARENHAYKEKTRGVLKALAMHRGGEGYGVP